MIIVEKTYYTVAELDVIADSKGVDRTQFAGKINMVAQILSGEGGELLQKERDARIAELKSLGINIERIPLPNIK